MANNKSTIFTGGGIPSPYNVIFLKDDGTKRVSIVDGLAVQQTSGGGLWASTESPDTFAAVGYSGAPGESGFINTTESPDTFAAVGYPAAVGDWASTDAKDVFSAYMTLPKVGTWASVEAADRFSAAGVGWGEDGVLMTTEARDVFAAVGNVPIAGIWASTEVPDQFSAISTGVVATQKRRVFFVT
jgi:hypothetical protein